MAFRAGVANSSELPSLAREERIAQNEAWTRSLNERRATWAGGHDAQAGFRCECWQEDCVERIPLSGEQWRVVRTRANQFAVAPGHVAHDFEVVRKEWPHFWLVEKVGKAGEVATQLERSESDRPG
jgi:hypothetical protein